MNNQQSDASSEQDDIEKLKPQIKDLGDLLKNFIEKHKRRLIYLK
jgi:hypothetical protein